MPGFRTARPFVTMQARTAAKHMHGAVAMSAEAQALRSEGHPPVGPPAAATAASAAAAGLSGVSDGVLPCSW